MSIMKSKFKYMYDAAPAASLLTKGGGAKVASFDGVALSLDELQGYWTNGELADQSLAVIINVESVTLSARTATITFATVIATDTVAISDGVDTVTFIAGTDFVVGANDTQTAANFAQAINDAYEDGDFEISAAANLAVITVTNHLGTGGTITEAETTITPTAFAGGNETYKLDIQAGPIGFASNAVIGTIAAVSGPGQYVVLLDMDTVKKVKATSAALRLSGTLAGVAPSITAHAWITGIQK